MTKGFCRNRTLYSSKHVIKMYRLRIYTKTWSVKDIHHRKWKSYNFDIFFFFFYIQLPLTLMTDKVACLISLFRHPLGALSVLWVHLLGFRVAQSVLRQGHRHLAHCLPAVWFCLTGGVRCGSSDAQQPETHRGREGQNSIQGEGCGKEPRCQEQHGQRDRRDAASCQHLACQCIWFDNLIVFVCLLPFTDDRGYCISLLKPDMIRSRLMIVNNSSIQHPRA